VAAAYRFAAWAPAAGWAAVIFYLSSRSAVPQPPGGEGIPFLDKIEHFMEYGLFAVLLLYAVRRGRRRGSRQWFDFDPHIVVAIACVYAFTDELHQAFVPQRAADPADFLVDTLAALVFAFAFSSRIPGRRGDLVSPVKEVSLPQGVVSYLDEGSGPAVLYIHGWHASKRYYEEAPKRIPGYRHVALDLLGFGASDSPARFSYSPHDQAEVVREFARAVGIDSAVVVGHSMGGAVAVELALLDPPFVVGLVLVEPALNLGVEAPFIVSRKDARAVGVGVIRHLRGLHTGPLLHLVVENPAALTPPLLDDARASPVHASARAITQLARARSGPRMPEVRAPVLLIFGDEAHAVRTHYARKVSEMIPHASLVYIPHTSHCPMIEAPDAFYKTVGLFLEREHRGGPPAGGRPP
jgi:3-oxoadipate enol-lactonase